MKSISLTAILHELVKDAPSGLPAKLDVITTR